VSIIEQVLKRAREERDSKASVSVAAEAPAAAHVNEVAAPVAALLPLPAARTIAVNLAVLRNKQLLVDGADSTKARELEHQYRIIKRNVVQHAFGGTDAAAPSNEPRLIMTASALPGDGKTFTCVNLAVNMAMDRDNSVLLIDGDVAKPQISQAFGMDDAPGLLDLLRDPSLTLDSLVVATEIPRLNFLPAGKWGTDAPELFGSERMKELLRSIAERARRELVLIDSSPILLTSESRMLASLVGQVVIIVSAGITPQRAVQDAVEFAKAGGARLALVLNRVETSGLLGYYNGYGLGSYYGYGRNAENN
jgi:protein-tyrosine kinase